MDLARYVVDAVVLEGRSYREVAQAHGVSKSWVGKLVGRFREGGYGAIGPRSRAARRIPHRTADALEDEICALRKELTELGVDAGAATIGYHLGVRHEHVPSISTIWRVLRRRGFVTPQPRANGGRRHHPGRRRQVERARRIHAPTGGISRA